MTKQTTMNEYNYPNWDEFNYVKHKQQEQIDKIAKKVGELISEIEELRKEQQESSCKNHKE